MFYKTQDSMNSAIEVLYVLYNAQTSPLEDHCPLLHIQTNQIK